MEKLDVQKHADYWRTSAAHDYKTMCGLFDIKRYADSLFYGHLVLEKTVKALYIIKCSKPAPKIHDLLRLAKEAGIDLNEEEMDLLDTVNDFNIRARYPDFKMEFYKKCNRRYTEKFINNIKSVYKRLCRLLKK